MSESTGLDEAAALYDQCAEELELAARHCRTASQHFRDNEVPRGAAHGWAAFGHVLEATALLESQARTHEEKSRP